MPLDKEIYCTRCGTTTLHQVWKLTHIPKVEVEEEYEKGVSYYARSQCMSCGKKNEYGNFIKDEIEEEGD